MATRALVLSGGGVAGIAWELGILVGLAEGLSGTQPRYVDADVVVGTSAGSVIAAAISGGTALESLFDTQLVEETAEMQVDDDLARLVTAFTSAVSGATSPAEARARIGSMALATSTVAEEVRRAIIAARLPVDQWGERRVLIPAVDTATGERVVFDKDTGVDLIDAVAASCAVPGVWPPITIGGRRYMDGGVQSLTNADLVGDAHRVLVITTMPPRTPMPFGTTLESEIDRFDPSQCFVIHADEPSTAAFGSNPLDPSTRGPSALAGRAQGRAVADAAAAFWVGD